MRGLPAALPATLALLGSLLCSPLAAQTPEDTATPAPADAQDGGLQLNMVATHPLLGELKLPLAWVVSEQPDGVRAVEPERLTQNPAAIELAHLQLPISTTPKALAEALRAELEETAAGLRLLTEEAHTVNEVEGHAFEALYEEEGHLMHLLVIVLPSESDQALIAVFGAPASRYEGFEPRELLARIVATIKQPAGE